MRIQPPILMDHDYAGQLRYRLGAGVSADRPHEISLDASVALRRGNGLVSGLDSVIGAGNLLAQRIIRHQCMDNRGCRQTAHQSLHALHKGAATNLTVNEIVVELYGFARKLGFCWFHWLTPVRDNTICFWPRAPYEPELGARPGPEPRSDLQLAETLRGATYLGPEMRRRTVTAGCGSDHRYDTLVGTARIRVGTSRPFNADACFPRSTTASTGISVAGGRTGRA